MKSGSIPQWTSNGVLPLINYSAPTLTDRSPYQVSLIDLILRYATSRSRSEILNGFLNFRAGLHTVGLDKGFQWIDGSFLEDIESIEKHDPHDIDVVTFFHLPDSKTQQSLVQESPNLFKPDCTKTDYHVDAYFVQLNISSPEPLVGLSAYWYGLWSHRRDGQWKGYLQIDLSSTDDQIARANLEQTVKQGCQP